jgi:hypothetical protein
MFVELDRTNVFQHNKFYAFQTRADTDILLLARRRDSRSIAIATEAVVIATGVEKSARNMRSRPLRVKRILRAAERSLLTRKDC